MSNEVTFELLSCCGVGRMAVLLSVRDNVLVLIVRSVDISIKSDVDSGAIPSVVESTPEPYSTPSVISRSSTLSGVASGRIVKVNSSDSFTLVVKGLIKEAPILDVARSEIVPVMSIVAVDLRVVF